MPNLKRPYNACDVEWEQTGFSWTLARLQADLLQRLARGEDLTLPQFVEIKGERDPFFPRSIILASGFLAHVLEPAMERRLFVLHADELHETKAGTPYLLLKTIIVEFHDNGMVYIKTHSKIADQAVMDDFLGQEDDEECEVISLRAVGA